MGHPSGRLALLAETSLAAFTSQLLTAGRTASSGAAAAVLPWHSYRLALLESPTQQAISSWQSSSAAVRPLALVAGLGASRCDASIRCVPAAPLAGSSYPGDSRSGPVQSAASNTDSPAAPGPPTALRRPTMWWVPATTRAVTGPGPAALTSSRHPTPTPAAAGCWTAGGQVRFPFAATPELRQPPSGPQLQGTPGGAIRFLSGGATSGSSDTPTASSAAATSSTPTSSTGTTPARDPAAARPPADAVYNLPNAVSAARLLSGPVIGYWLLQGHYETATIALAISGASDWLDGFLARRMGASSVFGSYLDPLADKVLIGCVAGALLANGSMPTWLAVVVVGRDALLVAGAFVFRLRGFGWRWPGREAFFRTADAAVPRGPGGGGGQGGEQGVAFMRPLLVSKANTVLQLVLLGGYLTRGMYAWPDGDVLFGLELATATTTSLSLAAYGTMALNGKLFKE